ncbi:MAG: TonB-dependent copper receptor [bacterium]|nr:TonB-dependent copper receptor [bacterium]
MNRTFRRNVSHSLLLSAVLIWFPTALSATGPGTSDETDTPPARADETAEAEEALEPATESDSYVVRDEIVVTDVDPSGPFVELLDKDELQSYPHGDGAELLDGIPGVSVGRMGGHGLEPRIRGLGEGNINVVIDGAYVHGGCPNRMDPPTSFAAIESFERVLVLKGVQTLKYGAGGSAGTVVFERLTPRLRDGDHWRLAAGAGYTTHSAEPEVTLDATLGSERFFFRTIAESRERDSYEDGNGTVVPSAFRRRDVNFLLGWTPDDDHLLELGLEANRTDDAFFPGAGMDSVKDDNDTIRLRFRRGRRLGFWERVQGDVYLSRVDHLMDNYSLRSLSAPMAAQAPSESDTVGGRISGDLAIGSRTELTLGVDFQQNQRQAFRFVGPSPEQAANLQSVLWPDATLRQGGFFAEGRRTLSSASLLRFGARVDRFDASAEKADLNPVGSNRTPNQLYHAYYGAEAGDWDHTDVSALLRYERELRPGLTLFAGLSRSVRPADTTERYLASNNAAPMKRWVGNPQIEPAKHHQIDLGLAGHGPSHQLSMTGFYDRVDEFILRDRAHGQAGISTSDGATIYRNVDAELFGLELAGGRQLGHGFSLSGSASYVYANNRTEGRPIAQIPPLQGRLRTAYEVGSWKVSATLQYAFEQDRVDDDPTSGSGLDVGETPGNAVFDFAAGYTFASELHLLVGVDNLFDRTYANHLNRSSLFDSGQVRVNEPGRSFWVRFRWSGGGS